MKRCTTCGITKNYSFFHKYGKSPDGHKTTCKVCVSAYDNVRNEPTLTNVKKQLNGKVHCRRCKEYFDAKDMYSVKSKTSKNSLSMTYCKQCNVKVHRDAVYRKHHTTSDLYEQMLKDQNGVCKICGNEETKQNGNLSIDHDHACCPGISSCGGCIRGLLCSHCNKVLGLANDNVVTLQKMINYLS